MSIPLPSIRSTENLTHGSPVSQILGRDHEPELPSFLKEANAFEVFVRQLFLPNTLVEESGYSSSCISFLALRSIYRIFSQQ